jgi:arsenite methyltransferase
VSCLDDVDTTIREFADAYDELPLWSAPFGLLLLERVPIRADQAVLDVGAGTGWLALELAERCGPRATVRDGKQCPLRTQLRRRSIGSNSD